jgi:Protein of unknown function (DUF2612).
MELKPLNVTQLIKDEIATEYRAATNLKGYVGALLCDHDVIDSLFVLIADRLNIDTQEGKNLDRIGKLVGQERGIVDAANIAFFGFAPHPQAKSFGSPFDPAVGGRFRSPGEPLTGNKPLTDPEYRIFIQARIFKNHARSTPDELITFLKLILGNDTPVYVQTAKPRAGHGWIAFGRRLTLNEQYLLTGADIMPRTTGVTYDVRDFTAGKAFGFNGAPFPVGGFGDPAVPGSGAAFARHIPTT